MLRKRREESLRKRERIFRRKWNKLLKKKLQKRKEREKLLLPLLPLKQKDKQPFKLH